jgi:hypothetical protein
MPASFIGEILFEMIVHPLVYGVGTVVVPIISFGRWKCDPLLRDVPKKKKEKWGGFYNLFQLADRRRDVAEGDVAEFLVHLTFVDDTHI